ncbi:MAG: autorepressor SdpR family transcription factor [Solirubrobacterales bacterium]
MSLNLAFKALSDKTRREILKMLQAGDLTAGEIADQFDMTKPSISHHLGLLKQAKLVQDVRKGQNMVYSINTTVFQEVMSYMLDLLGPQEDPKGNKEASKK